jgi:hypothetical protein
MPSPALLSVLSWSSPTSTQLVRTSSAAGSRSARCSIAMGAVFFPARIRNVAPISPMPRSAIRTAMAGSSRRSTRGFQAGTGKTDGRFWLQSGDRGHRSSVTRACFHSDSPQRRPGNPNTRERRPPADGRRCARYWHTTPRTPRSAQILVPTLPDH